MGGRVGLRDGALLSALGGAGAQPLFPRAIPPPLPALQSLLGHGAGCPVPVELVLMVLPGRGDHQQREPRRGEHRNHAALQLADARPLLPHAPLHQGERRHRGAERELPHGWGAPGRAGAAGPPPHPSLPWQSAEQGAVSTLYCAVSEEVSGITGKYFDSDCGLVLPSAAARDAGLAHKLWEESERLTGLSAGPQH